MTGVFYIGAALVLVLITVVGIRSGKNVKSVGDFATGGKKAGAGIVAGSIIGTLVGGASTIGTAQLSWPIRVVVYAWRRNRVPDSGMLFYKASL